MSIIQINITETGKHWRKEIRLFGLLIYSRHDYTEEDKRKPIGFTVFQDMLVEVEDEWEDE